MKAHTCVSVPGTRVSTLHHVFPSECSYKIWAEGTKLLFEDSENSVVAGRCVKEMAIWNIKESVVSPSLFFFSSVRSLKSGRPQPGSGHWGADRELWQKFSSPDSKQSCRCGCTTSMGPRRNPNYQSRFSRPISTTVVPKAWAELSLQFFFAIFS